MKNEVVVERLDTLIKQNKKDHSEIICHQEITNGKVIRNTKWRYSFISAGVVVTGAVIPLILYISANLQKQVDDLQAEIKVVSSLDILEY